MLRKARVYAADVSSGFPFHDRSQRINCLNIREVSDEPVTPAFPAPAVVTLPVPAPREAAVVPHAAVLIGGVTVGTVGASGVGPTKPVTGATVIVGTAGTALTPRLPISKDPSGIPVCATPPGVVGVVDVGVDEDVMLLEPEPHIPDNPAVSIVSEVVETVAVPMMLDDVDDPDDASAPAIAVLLGIAALPAVIAVAGVAVPIPIPPPSKFAVDPNMDDGAVPTVEHAVPLAVLGIVIVPVTPVGNGLSPGEEISVAPSGIPVGVTDVLRLIPSGEVAPRVGVVAIAPTCALAPLQVRLAVSAAAIKENLMRLLLPKSASPGQSLSTIGAYFATRRPSGCRPTTNEMAPSEK